MAEKLYRIGDAAELLGLKTYVLRYWEKEFSQLRPVRTGKGQRRYTETDVATLRRVQDLLHEQGLTIEGARKVLAGASALSLKQDTPVPASGPEAVRTVPVEAVREKAVPLSEPAFESAPAPVSGSAAPFLKPPARGKPTA